MITNPLTDPKLLASLNTKEIETAAWGEFVRLYGPRILAWCRRRGLQEADAEDVRQIVLMRVAQKMPSFQYDPRRSFRGWLRTLVHAAWCDFVETCHKRDRWIKRSSNPDQFGTLVSSEDPTIGIERDGDREMLRRVMARVQGRIHYHTWEAFRLLVFDGMSGEDAARQLKMNRGSLFAAKSKVQRMIKEELLRTAPEESRGHPLN